MRDFFVTYFCDCFFNELFLPINFPQVNHSYYITLNVSVILIVNLNQMCFNIPLSVYQRKKAKGDEVSHSWGTQMEQQVTTTAGKMCPR